MVTTEDLVAARAEANLYFPDTAAVMRPGVETRDPGGGITSENFALVVGMEAIPFRLGKRKQANYESDGSLNVREQTVGKCAAGTDIRENDQVVAGGKTWNVTSVEAHAWEVQRVVALEEV